MARRRRPKSASDAFLDILPQLVGLVLLAVFFVPGAKQFLGALLFVTVAVGVAALIGLIAWAIYRRRSRPDDQPQSEITTLPPLVRAATPTLHSPRPVFPAWSLELLRSLEWKRFEELICAYIRTLGYEARTTRLGADGGVDVEVIDPATKTVAIVVQCKAWNVYQVGIKPVRELYGVMAAEKVPQAAFFTTGTYTAEALAFGKQHDVDLVDGDELLTRFGQLQLSQSLQLLEDATRGDYTTPSCPSCGTKMVLRTAGKGTNEGSQFWGCCNYPRCRQTFKCTVTTAGALS